ncbi:MAG: SEC-C domain-containing protein [Chlorobium sp.]|jgi:hypothetical protein|nr:SEC-C domain-containing protein [Chlorobium sp.]
MKNQDHKVKFYPGNGSPFRTIKISRNDPCKCGSGKKAKNCCGVETMMYHSKPTPKAEEHEGSDVELKKRMDDGLKAKYPEKVES